MSIKKVALIVIPIAMVSMFALFVFRKKEFIQVDTLKKKAYQVGNEVRWTAGNLKFGKVYEVSLLKDSNVVKVVQSKFVAVSSTMTGSFVISGITPNGYKLALVSDNKVLDTVDIIVLPITPIQPPPPPPIQPPPKFTVDLVIQVKKGISFDLKFYGEGTLCNPKNELTYNIVKKESTNYYDWYHIKVNKLPVKERDYAYLHVFTSGKAYMVYPPYPPSYCDGIQAFPLTINWYSEYMTIE